MLSVKLFKCLLRDKFKRGNLRAAEFRAEFTLTEVCMGICIGASYRSVLIAFLLLGLIHKVSC